MQKNLAIILKANQEFIRHTEEDIQENTPLLALLFESITETYIPLLRMLENFEKDGITAKIGIVLPPVLCTLLNSNSIQQLYINWLEKQIELGCNELKRAADNPEKIKIIKHYIQKFTDTNTDFVEKYNKKLTVQFREYQKKGFIELLATCGTDIFVPHYMEFKEAISAQIETGLNAYKKYFGELPDGFWLPEMGYARGVEKLIRAYGFNYTVLHTRSFLFSQDDVTNGIFYPARTENSLALFGCDSEIDDFIYSEDGYASENVFRNENIDIGFELPPEKLEPLITKGMARIATGYKYYGKSINRKDGTALLYDLNEAKKSVLLCAEDFLNTENEKLEQASKELSNLPFVTLVTAIDLDRLRQNWNEGIMWLDSVIRQAASKNIQITSCNQMIEDQFTLQKITPYYASSNGNGYGEDFLSNKNSWMLRYTTKACERMIDLSDRFPNDTGLKARLLNIGAKEVMLAMSTGLAKMMNDELYEEYAEKRFKESIAAFTEVFDSLGSNVVSTEWLTKLETKDSFFSWMNYRIFSRKI